MSRIILCIDNGNSKIKDAAAYLKEQSCEVYVLQGMEEKEVEEILKTIEQKAGKLDLLLLSAGEQILEDGAIGSGHDDKLLLRELDEQLNGTRAIIEAALPLLRKSELKRIGMITKADSSVSLCRKDCNYGKHMIWAGLNMIGKIYFNLLRPEGFTFRWYCDTEDKTSFGGMSAGEYMLTGLCYDAKEPYIHSDENRLVMRDAWLREIPW